MSRFSRGLHLMAAVVGCVACEPQTRARDAAPVAGPPLVLRVAPERPIVETAPGTRQLNFEARLENRRAIPLRIARYTLSVTDAAGAVIFRRSVDSNAFVPSVTVLGASLVVPPGATVDIFNPFSTFDPDMPLAAVTVSLCLQSEPDEAARQRNRHRVTGDCDEQVERAVAPILDRDSTRLELPVRGRVVVWDGHDFLSHHLRVPLDDPRVIAEGLRANSNQFAEDFIYTDASGAQYASDPRELRNWFAYGKPVFAPASGTVIAAENGIPDNRFEDGRAVRIAVPPEAARLDPTGKGNYVVIDHGRGEYSLLLHLAPGSVTVAPGTRVAGGDPIGLIGFSGDSLFPHLHYALMDGPVVGVAWGAPSYFVDYVRIRGSTRTVVVHGALESGEIVESTAHASQP